MSRVQARDILKKNWTYPKNKWPWNCMISILTRPVSSLSNISKAEGLRFHSLDRSVAALIEPLIGFGYATLCIAYVKSAEIAPVNKAASIPKTVITKAIAHIPVYSRSI